MKITETDFTHLWGTACIVYKDLRKQEKDSRFRDVENHKPVKIDPKAKWAYWFENYSQVLFAKQFLAQNDYSCQVALDEHDEVYYAVIFSDYKHQDL